MTIYKTLQHDKKDGKGPDDPEVVMEPLTGGDHDGIAAVPKAVRVSTSRPNQSRRYVNLCLIIGALVVLGAGVIGVVFLYKHLSHRVTRGICGTSYYDEFYHQQSDFLRGEEAISIDLKRPNDEIGFKLDFFEEKVEVSELDGYERLEVPKFDECEKTEVWHDFQQNFTAIVDHSHANCFVMKLNRTLVAPPSDVIDLITKLRNGDYYFPRAEVIRQKYAVVVPPIWDLKFLGPFIMRECFWYETYRLEKINKKWVKRSAGSAPQREVHFGFSNFRDTVYKMTIEMNNH